MRSSHVSNSGIRLGDGYISTMDTFSASVATCPTPTGRAAVVGSVMYDVDPSGFGTSPEVSCMHCTAAHHLSKSWDVSSGCRGLSICYMARSSAGSGSVTLI